MINFLSNAAKFTKQGEIELSVREKEITMTSNGTYRAEFVFSLRDTGIGMSEGAQRKLFRPFEQVSSHL